MLSAQLDLWFLIHKNVIRFEWNVWSCWHETVNQIILSVKWRTAGCRVKLRAVWWVGNGWLFGIMNWTALSSRIHRSTPRRGNFSCGICDQSKSLIPLSVIWSTLRCPYVSAMNMNYKKKGLDWKSNRRDEISANFEGMHCNWCIKERRHKNRNGHCCCTEMYCKITD